MHIYSICGLTFLFGCFCALTFPSTDIITAFLTVVGVFLIKLSVFKTKKRSNLCILMLILSFSAGAVLGFQSDFKTFEGVEKLYGTRVDLEGKVSEKTDKKFLLETEYGYVTVFFHEKNTIKNNDIIKFNGILHGYAVSQYKGDFNSRLYYARKGVVGYTDLEEFTVAGNENSFSLWNVGRQMRHFLENRVDKFTAGYDVKGLIKALITGNTSQLEEGVADSFRKTGISHLVSVSGLHVSIFLSFFTFFMVRFRRNKFVYVPMVTFVLIFYILIIGERASLFRAGIMAVLACLLISFKKRSDYMVNLVIAGVVICVSNPYYATDAGFQLSFLATLAIVMFAEYLKFKTVTIPLVVMVFMLPFSIYYYNMLSSETVLVNILVLPFVPIVILFGYLGCFVPFLSWTSCKFASVIIWVADFFASLDFLHISIPSTNAIGFLSWFLAVCGMYMFFSRRKASDVAIILVAIVGLNGFAFFGREAERESYTINFINSGSYNVQHITTTDGREIFVDCGRDTADYVTKMGVGEIYMLVATNNMNGRYDFVENFVKEHKVYNVMLPEGAKGQKLKLENCNILYYNHKEHSFSVDGALFEFTEIEGTNCLLVNIYGKTVATPFGKNIANVGSCAVMSVSGKSGNCNREGAGIFINPTYEDDYKYITAQTGSLCVVFNNTSDIKLYSR